MTTNTMNQFTDIASVLNYLETQGRKVKKSKLYADIKRGILRRSKDMTYKQRDVDTYATTLPMGETPAAAANAVEERLRRRDDADVRIKEAEARKREREADVLEGRYIARDMVEQELAARAVAFNSGLKSSLEAKALDLIELVGGDQKLAHRFLREMELVVDEASNTYAQDMDIEVSISEGNKFAAVESEQHD